MRIVAVLNQKGGVGKTTTAVNLGAALALRGRRVLLLDCDPQGNLSDHLGIDPFETEISVYDVLTQESTLDGATQATATEGLFVVPSSPDLAAAEQELAGEVGREQRLRRAMESSQESYDWVFIDCPPSLGLLSLNAMAAARELIITVQTEYFAMRGLGQLDQIVQMVQQHVNPKLEILGILPTLVNPVTNLAREVIQEVREHYGDKVFTTRIRQNVRLAEAPGHQTHIFGYEPTSPGAKDYAALADELDMGVAKAKPKAPAKTQAPTKPQAPAKTKTTASREKKAVTKPVASTPKASVPSAVPTKAIAPEASTPPSDDTAATPPDDAVPPKDSGDATPVSPVPATPETVEEQSTADTETGGETASDTAPEAAPDAPKPPPASSNGVSSPPTSSASTTGQPIASATGRASSPSPLETAPLRTAPQGGQRTGDVHISSAGRVVMPPPPPSFGMPPL